jgi:hypothetical protein
MGPSRYVSNKKDASVLLIDAEFYRRWDDDNHEESARIASEMKATFLPDKPYPSRVPLLQKSAAERAAKEKAPATKLASANVEKTSNSIEANVVLQKPTGEIDIAVEKKYGEIGESR